MLDNIDFMSIGSPLENSNIFRNARIGIAALNTGVSITNNRFEYFIEQTSFSEPNGYAIYSRSLPSTTPSAYQYLYVGDGVNIGPIYSNIFNYCTHGIYAYNIHRFNIIGNDFYNNFTSTQFPGIGICVDEVTPVSSPLKSIAYNRIWQNNTAISWLVCEQC